MGTEFSPHSCEECSLQGCCKSAQLSAARLNAAHGNEPAWQQLMEAELQELQHTHAHTQGWLPRVCIAAVPNAFVQSCQAPLRAVEAT
eukprot:332622-Chlamydomonas_euryale.AAC.1